MTGALPSGRRPFRRSLLSRARSRSRLLYKLARAALDRGGAGPRRVVFLFGHNNSGGSTLMRLLDRSPDTRLFGEHSVLTGRGDAYLRLRPLPEVRAILARGVLPTTVIECKLESQRARALLDAFEGSSGIWLYRDCRDSVAANVAKFTSQVESVRGIVQPSGRGWRSEGSTADIRAALAPLFADDMTREDAAALLWYARSALIFDQGLDTDPRMHVCRFDDVVRSSGALSERLGRGIGIRLGGALHPSDRSEAWIGIGNTVRLSEPVERICVDLETRLDRCDRRVRVDTPVGRAGA